MFDFYEPIYFPILHKTLDLKSVKKPHLWEVEIWIYHMKIDGLKANNKKIIQKWIKDKGWDIFYKAGECMIYIKINEIHISYWAFMENKYYLD